MLRLGTPVRLHLLVWDKLVTLHTHALTAGAPVHFGSRHAVTQDVSRVHIEKKVPASRGTFEDELIPFLLVAHEGKHELAFDDALRAEEG